MARDIQIKTKNSKTRNNISKYLTNVAKSTAYVTVDTVQSMNPSIKNFVDSNSDLSRSIYESVKEYKSVLKAVSHKVKESEYYKVGKAGIENTLDDLKTGKFYNREREDAITSKIAIGDDDDFLDFDFDIDNLDFDDDGSSEEEVLDKKDKAMLKEMDTVARASSNAIGATTIESAKYIAGTQKASTKLLYDQNNRLLGTLNVSMATVAANMQQVVLQQQAIGEYINEAKVFHVDTSRELKKTNELLTKMLEVMEKPMQQPEQNRKDKVTYTDIDNGMGGIDLKAYGSVIKKNVKNSLGGGMLDMFNMFEGGNVLETFVASPLKFVIDGMVQKAIPQIIKQSSEQLNNSLAGMFASSQSLLESLGEENILYKIFHVNNKLKTNIDPSKYNKAQTVWTGIDHKALTEVIPDQLAEIVSILSGTEKRLFDYDKGVYNTVSKIKDDFIKSVDNVGLNAGSDVIQELKSIMSGISFENMRDREALVKSIEELFKNAGRDNKLLDIYSKDFDLTQYGVDRNSERYLRSMLKAVSRDKMLMYNQRRMESIAKFTNAMQSEEDSGNSIYRAKFNNSELKHIKTDKYGKVLMDKDTSLIANLSLNRVKDDLGHNVFYYLQNMYQELVSIRQYNSFSPNGQGGYGRNLEVIRRDANGNDVIVYTNYDGKKVENFTVPNDTPRDYESERELNRLLEYDRKREREIKDRPTLVKSEDLEKLNDRGFDASIAEIARESREREGLVNIKPISRIGFLEQMAEAETVADKTKVIVDNVKELVNQPTKILASAMQAADKALYTIIYGDKRDKDGKRKGFMNEMMEQMRFTFTKFNNWLESLVEPVKEKLGVNQFREVPGKLFEHIFGISPHEVWTDFKTYLFGRYEEDSRGNRYRAEDGIFSFIGDGIKEAFTDAGNFLSETFRPIKEFIDGKKKPKENTQTENEEDIFENGILRTDNTSTKRNALAEKRQEIIKNSTAITPENIAYYLMNSDGNGVMTEEQYKALSEDYKNNKVTSEEAKRKLEAYRKMNIVKSNSSKAVSKMIGGDDSTNAEFINELYNRAAANGKNIDNLNVNEVLSLLTSEASNKRSNLKVRRIAKDLGKESFTYLSLDKIKEKYGDDYAEALSSFIKNYELDGSKLSGHGLNEALKSVQNNFLLNPKLVSYIKSQIRNDEGLGNLKWSDFVDETNKPKTTADAANELVNNKLLSHNDIMEITKTFLGDDPNALVGGVGNIENILEDILDAVRYIAQGNHRGKKGKGALPERRSRVSASNPFKIHSRLDVLRDLADAGDDDAKSSFERSIRDMEYKLSKLKDDGMEDSDEFRELYSTYNKYKIPTMAFGGLVKKTGPVILSEGEYVFNPADEETKKKQSKIEKAISDKLGGHIKMLSGARSTGTAVEFSNDDVTSEIVDGRYRHKVYHYNGERYYAVNNGLRKEGDKKTIYKWSGDKIVSYKSVPSKLTSFDKVKADVEAGQYQEGEEPLAYKTYTALSNGFNSAAQAMGITKDDKDTLGKAAADVMKNIKKYAPYSIGTGLIGGGVGLLLGGPILGAASGVALGLIHKSDEVKNWLFGEEENGERQGGVIPKSVLDTVNKYLPDTLRFGTIGGIGGLLTSLITPIGPVGGILIGSAVAFAKNNDEVKKTLFGEDWENKSKEFGDKLKKMVPSGIAGALVGSLALSPTLGLIPALAVGGITGMLTNTEPIKRALFGNLNPDGTRDNTGLFGAIKDGIVTPIKEHSKDIFNDIKKWLREDIFDPVKNAIAPMFKSITKVGGSILGFIKDKIDNSFDKGLSTVLAKWLKDNVIGKMARRAGRIGRTMLSPAASLISAPFRAVGAVGNHIRGRHIAKGDADYMSARERLEFRQNRLEKRGNKSLFGLIRNKLPFSGMRGDTFEEFDEYLASASDDQLKELREQVSSIEDPTRFHNKKVSDAERALNNQIFSIGNGITHDQGKKIADAIKSGKYGKARNIIGSISNLNEFTRDRLTANILAAGAEYNSAVSTRSAADTSKKGVLSSIRNAADGKLFRGIKSFKDIKKIDNYLDKEIHVRNQKSDVEIQTEKQAKQHAEIVDLFKAANDSLKAIADPEYGKVKRAKERHEALVQANKKYGYKGIIKFGGNRKDDNRVADFVTDPETGEERIEYVGVGSKYHQEDHPKLYDKDGNYKFANITGNAPVADGLLKHIYKRRLSNLTSLYEQQGMTTEEARSKAKDALDNRKRKGIWNNLKGYASDLTIVGKNRRIVNTARELSALNNDGDDQFYQKYLGQKVSRKDLYKASEQITRQKLIDKLKRENNTYSDEDAGEEADRQIEAAKKKKSVFYRFVNNKRLRMRYNDRGEPELDKSDSQTIKNNAEINERARIQGESYTLLSSIGNSFKSIFDFLRGKNSKEDGQDSIWKKLGKGFLKVMGVWTLLSLGPFMKKFIKDTVYPTIKPIIEPIVPTIQKIGDKLEHFFTVTFPNTIFNIGRGVVEWASGTGEYQGSGLPYVFKNHIVPFYMSGIEFLMTDIIPATVGVVVKHLPTMLLNTAKNISKMWSWNFKSIFSGRKPIISNNDTISSTAAADDLNAIKNNYITPYASDYKSMFQGNSPDVTGEEASVSSSDVGYNDSDYEETDNNSFSYKIKDMFGLNKTKPRQTTSQVTINDEQVPKSAAPKNTTNNVANDSEFTTPQGFDYGFGNGHTTSKSAALYGDESAVHDYDYTVDESEITDNGDGTATYETLDGSATFYRDAKGDFYISDSNGTPHLVTTDQQYNYSSADGKYHTIDENGNDVAITTPQLFSQSLTSIGAQASSALQDEAAIGKDALTQFLVGRKRGNVGGAVIRAGVFKTAGLAGLTRHLPSTGLKGLATSPIRFIGDTTSSVAKMTKDIGKHAVVRKRQDVAKKMAKKYGQSTTEAIEKATTRALKEAAKNSVDDVTEKALKEAGSTTWAGKLVRKITESLSEAVCNTRVLSWLSKAFGNFSETAFKKSMNELAEKCSSKILKNLLKKGSSGIAKVVSKFSPIGLAFAFMDFIEGVNNAQINLGIMEEPTMAQKALSGLVTLINSVVTLGLVPESWLYDVIISINPGGIFDDLQQQRSDAQEFTDLYNEVNNEHYNNISEILEAENKSTWDKIKEFVTGTEDEKYVKLREQRKAAEDAQNKIKAQNISSDTLMQTNSIMYMYSVADSNSANNVALSGLGSGLPETNQETQFNKVSDAAKVGTFISQNDAAYANIPFGINNEKLTIADAGCGPAAAAMVTNDAKYGIDTTSTEAKDKDALMKSAISYASNKKYRSEDGGVTTNFFKDYFSTQGISSLEYKTKFDITNQIENGSRMVVLGKDKNNKSKATSPFGPNGHYVVVNGVSKDNKYVFVNDPELRSPNVPYEKTLFMKGVQYAVKAINKDTLYNVAKSSGMGNIFTEPEFAALYQDLCTWSPITKSAFAKAAKDLCDKKHPEDNILVYKSNIFLEAAKESELDPRFLLALAAVVSDWGTNSLVKENNNPFAIINDTKNEYIRFASIEDGIIEGAKYIKHCYYMLDRYCMKQMSDTTGQYRGPAYNPISGWSTKVAKLMTNKKMPNNSRPVTYLERRNDVKDVIPVLDKPVYDVTEGTNALNMISKVSSVFTKIFNAIFGFGETEKEEKTDDSDVNYLKSNGHSYACYCKDCHPEMYDDNGAPINTKSILYQYILGSNGYYSDLIKSNDKSHNPDNAKTAAQKNKDNKTKVIKDSNLLNTVCNILNISSKYKGYIEDPISYSSLADGAKNNANRYINKVYLLGAIAEKLNLDLNNISKPDYDNTTTNLSAKNIINLGRHDMYVPNAKTTGIDQDSLSTYEEYLSDDFAERSNNYNNQYFSYTGINNDHMARLYKAILWKAYTGGYMNNDSVTDPLYAGVSSALIKTSRTSTSDFTESELGTVYNSKDKTIPEQLRELKDLYDRYRNAAKNNNAPIGEDVNGKKYLLAKTKNFDPSDQTLKNLKLIPITDKSSNIPKAFIAEAEYKNYKINRSNIMPFQTKLLGIPVYGLPTNYEVSKIRDSLFKSHYASTDRTSAWEFPWYVDFNTVDADNNVQAYKEGDYAGKTQKELYNLSYGNEYSWGLDSGLVRFKKKLGLNVDKKDKNKEKTTTEQQISYPEIELYYLRESGDEQKLTINDKDYGKFYMDYYNASKNEASSPIKDLMTEVANKSVEFKENVKNNAVNVASLFVDTSEYNGLADAVEDELKNKSSDNGDAKGSGLVGKGSGLGGSFVSQLDPMYSNIRFNTSKDTVKQTIGEAGCAPAVATMAINGYTGGASMRDMASKALRYKVKNGGTSSDYFSDVFSENGISSSYTKNTSDIKKSLRGGKSVVLLGQDKNNRSKENSPFGPGGHYVLANGISNDGTKIFINDPESSTPNKPYSTSILKNTSMGISVGGKGTGIFKHLYGGSTVDDMHIGNNGINLICEFEGFMAKAYHGKGETYWTIGYGHYGSDVKPGDTITKEDAKKLLAKDCSTAEGGVKRHIKKYFPNFIPTQNQFDALVSYVFNRGEGAAEQLFRETKNISDIPDNIVKYWGKNTAAKKGLIRRRKAERELYLSNAENFVPSGDYSYGDSTSSNQDSSINIMTLANKLGKAFNSVFGFKDGTDSSSTTGGVVGGSDLGNSIANTAASYIDKISYNKGGTDIEGNKGADCSGFAYAILKKFGYTGPRFSSKTGVVDDKLGPAITEQSEVQPGDILFFSSNGKDSGVHHVGIAVSNTEMIEMRESGTKCMRSKIRKGFYKARRYAESSYAQNYSGSGSGISIDEGFDILNKYTSTDGYGSSIIKSTKSSSSLKPANTSSSNLKPVKQVSNNNTISLSPEVILLIRECLKALNKISKNSDQMKTIVSLLTKIVTNNSKSDNNKNDKNKKSSKSSSSKDAQPIILNNKNDNNYEDKDLELMIKKLTELSQM